jgi:hypothetical protein
MDCLVLNKLMIDSKAYETMAALSLMALSPEQGLATQKDAEIKLMHQPRPTPTDAINLI